MKLKIITTLMMFVLLLTPTLLAVSDTSYIFKKGDSAMLKTPVKDSGGGACVSCTCDLTVLYPNGSTLVDFQTTSMSNGFASYSLNENQTETTGEYSVDLTCNDGSVSGSSQFSYEITPTGKEITLTSIIANISLMVFFFILILGFYFTTKTLDYERWYNSIITKYEYRNYVKVIISSIGYNLLKNKFIWYYLLGLPIILMITNVSFIFDVESMVGLMKVILAIYYFGFLLVTVFFFGYLQEWVSNILNLMRDREFGIEQ